MVDLEHETMYFQALSMYIDPLYHNSKDIHLYFSSKKQIVIMPNTFQSTSNTFHIMLGTLGKQRIFYVLLIV